MLPHKIKNQNFSSFVRVCYLGLRMQPLKVSLDDDPLKRWLSLVMRAFFFFFERFPESPLSKAFSVSTLGARKFLLDKAVNLAGFFTDGAMDGLRH